MQTKENNHHSFFFVCVSYIAFETIIIIMLMTDLRLTFND